MLRFAFAVLLVAAIQPAFSVPTDSGPSLVQRLQIVGHAAVEVFKSVGELGKNLTTIVEQNVRSEAGKLFKLIVARITITILASGHDYYLDEGPDGHTLSPAELRQFRVISTSVDEVFGRLDTMEAANEVIVRTIRQVLNETSGTQLTKEEVQHLIEALNRNFQSAEWGLRQAYEKAREKYEAQVPFPSRKDRRNGGVEDLHKNKKFAKSFLNLFFLQFTYNRLTTPRERFILARSVLELAKNPAKFDRVQRIYDETVSTQSESFDLQANESERNQFFESWFAKLKENFEKHQSLYEELKSTQKYVAERKDWDRSIFDMNV